MKKLFAILLFLPGIALASPQQQAELQVPKGMISAYDSLNLDSKFVKDAQNVFFDKDLGASKRTGYQRENSVSFGSFPVTEMFDFTQATSNPGSFSTFFTTGASTVLLLFSGTTMAYSLGAGTFTVIMSTLNKNYPIDGTAFGGRFYVVNGDVAFAYVNGTRTVDVPSLPKGTMIESHANRLWVTGVAGDESSIYGSAFLDGTNWTLGGNAGDPVQIPISNNDGGGNTCMRSFGDALIIGKISPPSLWALIGKSQLDFQLKNLSKTVGCYDDHTMREKQGALLWLSQRGLEKFTDGIADPPFGNGVSDLTDKLLSGPASGSGRSSLTDSSKADFDLGTSSYADLGSDPGSVFISSPAVYISTTLNFVPDTGPGYDKYNDAIDFPKGAFAISFVSKMDTKILDASLTPMRHGSQVPDPSWMVLSTGDAFPTLNTIIVASATLFQNYTDAFIEMHGVFFASAPVTLTSGVTYWISVGVSKWAGGTGDMSIQTTTDPAKTSLYRLAKTTDYVTGPWNVYATSTPWVDINLSSAQILSSVKDLGSTVQGITFFDGNQVLNDGQIFYYVRSGNSVAATNAASWTSQSLGQAFAGSTNRFVQWRADFCKTTSSQNPILQDITISWVNTSRKPHMASWVVDGRYYLSGSTNAVADTTNETILVVDKFDNFSRLNGMNAASFASAFGETYFGTSMSSGPQSGLYYRMNDSFSDDGTAINAFVRTGDSCFGIEQAGLTSKYGGCAQDKYFSNVYVKTKNDNSTGGTFSTSVTFDRDGTDYALGSVSLDEDSGGLIFAKIPFPLGTYGVRARAASFLFGNSQLGHDFRYYGGTVYFRAAPVE